MALTRNNPGARLSADEIKSVEAALRDVGSKIIWGEEGTFGPSTRRAVSEFQRGRGLRITGEPDAKTLALLRSQAATHRKSASSKANEAPPSGIPRPGYDEGYETATPYAPIVAAPPAPKTVPQVRRFIVDERSSRWMASRAKTNAHGRRARVAFDKDMRSEEVLGKAVTDGEERYEIAYTAAKFKRAEKRTTDLIVRLD